MSKITYNQAEKILSIRLSKESSVDSDVRDNVVIDYNQNGQITNIDIMSFSLDEFQEIPLFAREAILADKFKVGV